MKRDPMEHGGKRISGGRWLMAGMCVCVLSSSVFAEPPAPVSDPAFQHRIEEIVQQYIKDHPEVIEASLAALDARRTARSAKATRPSAGWTRARPICCTIRVRRSVGIRQAT